MSRLFAVKHGKYVVVDFNNVTEKGLKSLVTALNRAGQKVVDVEATNKKSRKDGLFVKKAKLFFERGQSVTIFIGDQGDIFQMMLNGTKQPVPQANSERELAKEIVKAVERNQAKFDKSQLRKAKKPKSTSSDKPLSRSLKKRVEEAKQHTNTLSQSQGEMTAQLESKKAELNTQTELEQTLTNKLEAEKAETAELESQLAALQEQANDA